MLEFLVPNTWVVITNISKKSEKLQSVSEFLNSLDDNEFAMVAFIAMMSTKVSLEEVQSSLIRRGYLPNQLGSEAEPEVGS